MRDEAAARAWVETEFHVPRETMERLDAFLGLLIAENRHQNLVSRASIGHLWLRHVADSAQLLRLAPESATSWIDLGTGAGFPGLIVALLHGGRVALVEERKLRADFLRRAVEALGVSARTEVLGSRVEKVEGRPFDVISARAFAPLPKLLALGTRFSTDKTRWILPKGRNARSELEAAESSWQGEFRIEPSLTDPDAGIIVAQGVKRKRA
ncbi:MAG TPA: 16S rRNA (guanine(527)-N(7))-methyltransferase RsmG [Allosphingosinicella sp.]|nr:16S rRNA (guanine(527)-N(7))-methyltransferase RsmG [Allosphingosinicella sp.]